MKKIVLVFSIILIITGCNSFSEPKISDAEAMEIVLKEHTRHIGEVEIVSVHHERNVYVVEWANNDNCENGKDYVSDQDGQILKGETTIC